jgi:hypothetical protein
VESTVPQSDADDISLDTLIEVTFSEAINPATVSSSSFKVEDESSTSVNGVVNYNDLNLKATFTPDTDLEEFTTYTAILSSSITDTNNNNLDCNGNGVYDPGEEYTWSFTTAVYPPVISEIPTQRPVEGDDLYLNLTTYVSDPNTLFNDLVITENSSYARIDGDNIIFNYPDGMATDVVNLSVSDGISEVWRDIFVEVKPTNNAPEISNIMDIYATEDIDKIVDMSVYVSDVDNELSELVVLENSSFAKVNGMELIFNYPNGILWESVNISVTDGYKLDFQHVNVYVTPVNDAPYLDGLDDRTVAEDNDLEVNLTKKIVDVDNELDELKVTTNSSYAKVEKIGKGEECAIKITFNYPNGISNEMVKVTVSDGDKDHSRTINITVNPVNDAPLISDIPLQYAVEDEDYLLDLADYITDIDTDLGDLNPYLNSVYLIGTDGLELTFNYPNGITEDTVNISIKDDKLRSYVDVDFVITPVNDQPTLYDAEITPGSGDTDTEFTFTVIYWDIDGDDEPTVEVVVGGNRYEMNEDTGAAVGANRQRYTLSLKIKEGSHECYFHCNDNSGEINSTYQTEAAVLDVEGIGLITETGSMIMIGIIIVIIIIVAVVLLYIFVLRKKFLSKQEPDEIEPLDQQEEDEIF